MTRPLVLRIARRASAATLPPVAKVAMLCVTHNGARTKAGLNTSILDAGWHHFLNILACKAAWAGKRAEAVLPAYITQDCSGCRARVPKSLSIRTHVCPDCSLVLDRDENAAKNIQWRGQRLRGVPALAGAMN